MLPRWLPAMALALVLPGCGEGLLGMEHLPELTGFDDLDIPESPAWVIRWMMEEAWVDGEPLPVFEEDMYFEWEEDDEDTWYHYVDFMEVLAPDLVEPPGEAIRGHGAEYLYAVGLPMLLDDHDHDGFYQPPVPDDPGDLWGATPYSALLWVDGNLDLFADSQPVGMEMFSDECECAFNIEWGLQNVFVEFDVLNLWWELEAIQEEMGEEVWHNEMRVLWPDDPHVLSTDHERSFQVQSTRELDEWFVGGSAAYTSEAWWAWFHDPEGEPR